MEVGGDFFAEGIYFRDAGEGRRGYFVGVTRDM